ncbi:hypothetical protein [Telmatospirillum sp. J64-1]|uniref:hypothetical protein n=1 Tax=Telmatospirillum sp. J64-1 TaxID=2502183 RepID=UPI00115C5627|nr:hypothetical protein [Telmatospirillum sp. J64-1]
MTLQSCLDHIYSGYLAAKPLLAGRPDSETRDPRPLMELLAEMRLIPPAERVIRVTGSKGKGSVSRLAAAALTVAGEGPVGLVVSPEEDHALDRIRIDGQAIPEEDFIAVHARLKPRLDALAASLKPGRYLSPFGLFLAVALAWFKEKGVRRFVIEGGRGVRHDETGLFPSATSIVTSILPEHLAQIGPTEEDVARDKLSIAANSRRLLLGPLAASWADRLGIPGESIAQPPAEAAPAWYELDRALAQAATGHPVPLAPVPSFGRCLWRGREIVHEAAIAPASLDFDFLARLKETMPGLHALVSLPDDKDVTGVVAALESRGLPPFHVELTGERGFLSHETAKRLWPERNKGAVRYDDAPALAEILDSLPPGPLYLAGTQTFLRLVRRMIAAD